MNAERGAITHSFEAYAGVKFDAGDTIYHRGDNFVDVLRKEARTLGIPVEGEAARLRPESRKRGKTPPAVGAAAAARPGTGSGFA